MLLCEHNRSKLKLLASHIDALGAPGVTKNEQTKKQTKQDKTKEKYSDFRMTLKKMISVNVCYLFYKL